MTHQRHTLLIGVAIAIALATLLASASPARADNGFKSIAEGGITAAFIGELVLPDFRLSFPDDKRHWLMSFPITPVSANIRFAHGKTLALQPTMEPQYQFDGSQYRLPAQVRAMYFTGDESEIVIAPLLELGAVTGTDGGDGVVGAELGLNSFDRRRLLNNGATTDAARHEV
ncbi:MAG: hypothetical protein KBG15_05200 [Kofleriaceae bacterium]|nr:hypothetical protein [Kofleriaceae bacterium]